MPGGARTALIVIALLCGGFITLVGTGFAAAVEPEEYTAGVFVIYLGIASLTTAPMWIPAVIPNRFPTVLRASRWISAAILLIPTAYFGIEGIQSVAWNLTSQGARPKPLASLMLAGGCAICMGILLVPELRTMANRATSWTHRG